MRIPFNDLSITKTVLIGSFGDCLYMTFYTYLQPVLQHMFLIFTKNISAILDVFTAITGASNSHMI